MLPPGEDTGVGVVPGQKGLYDISQLTVALCRGIALLKVRDVATNPPP